HAVGGIEGRQVVAGRPAGTHLVAARALGHDVVVVARHVDGAVGDGDAHGVTVELGRPEGLRRVGAVGPGPATGTPADGEQRAARGGHVEDGTPRVVLRVDHSAGGGVEADEAALPAEVQEVPGGEDLPPDHRHGVHVAALGVGG